DQQAPNKAGKQQRKNDFQILSPAPYDIWTSGSVETLRWIGSDLPSTATFDISLIPVDPEMNPGATELRRRPLLRQVDVKRQRLNMLVPYDMITKEQLMKEQEDGGVFLGRFQDSMAPTTGSDKQEGSPSLSSLPNVRSVARLYITAYEGRTDKVLVRKSVFPVMILKDHTRDKRIVLAPPPILDPAQQPSKEPLDGIPESVEEPSEVTDFGNSGDLKEDTVTEIVETDGVGIFDPTNSAPGSGAPTMDSESSPSDASENFVEEEPTKTASLDRQPHPIQDEDPFQDNKDLESGDEPKYEPSSNAPVQVVDAGTIQITQWVQNKERFFVGAPYGVAWEFPESEVGNTGQVSVYVEDAHTGKRYDMVAGPMPSSVQFMYLHPREIMMSADPRKRIYLRVRVEMDLLNGGNIHRYTGFSKMFWVQRGAL
ncbi:hypothetical protein BGX31_002595, partial [Mortierella sp. GBA43]